MGDFKIDFLVDDFWKDQKINNQPHKIPSFFIRSTSPINVEEEKISNDKSQTISDVIESLYQNCRSNNNQTGLVIQIHGYNTGVKSTVLDTGKIASQDYDYISIQDGKRFGVVDSIYKGWKEIAHYINQIDSALYDSPEHFVYLGYRWPSESVLSGLCMAATALPIMLKILIYVGLMMGLIGLTLLILLPSLMITKVLTSLFAIVGFCLFTLVGTLFVLRIIVYFRDSYRATNFGVPDLVEFIRQLDLGIAERHLNDVLFEAVVEEAGEGLDLAPGLLATAVRKTWETIETDIALVIDRNDEAFRLLLPKIKQRDLTTVDDAVFLKIYASFVSIEKPSYTPAEYQWAANYWKKEKPRIRLTFVGHSMGGLITAQVARILSNTLGSSTQSVEVGNCFSLGRLILASPDIPFSSIYSGRASFLREALKLFEEAHLFSNDGDLALRLASTAANYFSFPASTRSQGYRLGNLSLTSPESIAYGIVNLENLLSDSRSAELLKCIGVRTLKLLDPRKGRSKEDNELLTREKLAKLDPESIAELFSYFDCTEYRDLTTYAKRANQEMNVLICKGQRAPLNFWMYAALLKAYIGFSVDPSVGVDVHGGYFYGHLTKFLIYRIAFLGTQGLLDSIISCEPEFFNLKSRDFQERLLRAQPLPAEARRTEALKYISWLCEQKRIRVALSPDRYYVDVLGLSRKKVKKGITGGIELD